MDNCPAICNNCSGKNQAVEKVNEEIGILIACDNCGDVIQVGEYFWQMETCESYFCDKCANDKDYNKADTKLFKEKSTYKKEG